MKKGILALAVTLSFSYQLAVSKADEQKLKNCGINCVEEGNVCIFFEGDDKFQGERIRNYIFTEYGIQSFYIGNDSLKTKKVKTKRISKEKVFKRDSESLLPDKPLKHIYSYQILSTKNLDAAKKIFKKIKNYPQARIEKIGKYYVVRYGLFKSVKEAKKYKGQFLTKCYYIPQRVVR
jgi:hypothetical protein